MSKVCDVIAIHTNENIVPQLFAKERSQCIHVHGRNIPQLIELLKINLTEEKYELLKTAQEEVRNR